MSVNLQQLRCSQHTPTTRHRRPCIHASLSGASYRLRKALTDSIAIKSAAPCRNNTAVVCRQRQDWGGKSSSRKAADKAFRFKFNQIDVSLAEDEMWRLLLPFAAVFGLAVFIGPLVVGITLSAIAVGAAFSAGALAFTTLLLPLILLTGFGGLLSFGLMATVGAAFVIPKMIFSMLSLAVVGGGLLLGWGGVNWLLSQQSSATSNQSSSGFQNSSRQPAASRSSSPDVEVQVEDAKGKEDVRRMASELREFDELLARKEEQRRIKQWERDSR